MYKKYIKSQSGATLILVLFLVLFLSIVGTALLNTTTYSMKSVVQNEMMEREFYLAEGALDLVVSDISNNPKLYNELKNRSSKQMFLESSGFPREIAGIPMRVELKKISETSEAMTVELVAGYDDAKKSNNKRVLKLQLFNPNGDVSSHPILYSIGSDPLNYSTGKGNGNKKTYPLLLGVTKSDVIHYERIYSTFYQYFVPNGEPKRDYNIVLKNDDVSLSGQEKLNVGKNTIYIIAGTLTLKGNSYINIEKGGILLVNTLTPPNNSNKYKNTINGALIVNKFDPGNSGSNSMDMQIEEDAGISCDIINSIGLSNISGCGSIKPQTKLVYKVIDYSTQ